MCCPVTLCQDVTCPVDLTAVCRINSCGGCVAEFFNAQGQKLDCETGIGELNMLVIHFYVCVSSRQSNTVIFY